MRPYLARLIPWCVPVFKGLLPIVVLVAAVLTAKWLIATKPQPPHQPPERRVPAVRAARAVPRTVCFPIRSQGTVRPRMQSTLVAQVSGRIVAVADCFDESGFFSKGEVLAEIDRRDYELQIRRLEASIRSAEAQQTEARQNLDRQHALQERRVGTKAELDRAQAAYDMAVAGVAELQTRLDEARNALADTSIVAPYDGCIRRTHADLGQYVTTGTALADCFATDAVEVRLPIDDEQFAFLGIPLGREIEPGIGPKVLLQSHFAGATRRWEGEIVRSEAIVDSQSRMVYLVAEVQAPYENTQHSGGQPLAVGMFFEAEIRCRPVAGAMVLPESCVDSDGRLLVIDSQQRLQPQTVEVLRREADWVVVTGNLAAGSRVCATPLERAVPGMQVNPIDDVTPDLASLEHGGVVDLSADFRLARRPADNASAEE